MDTNWKNVVFDKAESLIREVTTPLPMKELAWRAIKFAKNCGKSNPVSFALRPIASNRRVRSMVGINLILMMVLAGLFGPFPSFASDTGGTMSLVVLSEDQISLTTEETVRFPLPMNSVSQKFWLFHAGIDLRAPVGTPINPVMAGRVVEVEYGRFGYGNKIVIGHRGGHSSLYAHLSKINVSAGDEVTTETIIGETGNTGRSTGPHLHLEVLDNGKPIDPVLLLGTI